MKFNAFFLLFFASFIHAQCKTLNNAYDLYRHQRYDEAKEMASELIHFDSMTTEANLLLGRIYVDLGRSDSAIPYLQLAIKLDKDSSYISGWAYGYLGYAHFNAGDKEKATSELQKAISLHKTTNSVRYAQHKLDLITPPLPHEQRNQQAPYYVSLEPNWVKIEGNYITYYFQDTAGISVINYIKQHERAYVKINETFQAALPKKLVFYVWNDRELAKKILQRELGFTNPEACVVNAAVYQSVGHEMTHALSHWAWGYRTKNKTRLINEGVAVAFDQSNYDKNIEAKNSVAGKNIHSILDIWENENADESVVYPVGGAFLSYLYNKCNQEQFRGIIKDQRIENAKTVLGKEKFEAMVTDFDKMIGFQ